MTVATLGTFSIADALPGVGVAVAAGADGLGLALPDVAARITALAASLSALSAMPFPPDFSASLAGAQLTLASVQLAMATPGLLPPSLDAVLTAVRTQLEAIESMLSALVSKAAIIANFQTLMAGGAVALYSFDGARSSLGAELDSAVSASSPGPGATPSNALVLYTEDPATWSAMHGVFRV